MSAENSIDPEIIEVFVEEVGGLVGDLDQALAAPKASPADAGALETIHRGMHTLKGTSALLGFDKMASLAGPGEDVAKKLMSGETQVTGDVTALFAESYDVIKVFLDDLKAGGGGGGADVDGVTAKFQQML